MAVRQGEHAGHILEDERLRFKLVNEANVVPKQSVSRIIQKPLRRIDRKSLAWWPPGDHSKFGFFETKSSTKCGYVYFFNWPRVSPSLRVIKPEGLDR